MTGAICPPSANTGVPALALLGLATVLLVVGAVLVVLGRRRRGRIATAVVLLMFLGVATTTTTLASRSLPARAAVAGCAPHANPVLDPSVRAPSADPTGPTPAPTEAGVDSLSITQTSTMSGLGPGVVPAVITGTVRNVSDRSTFVATVTVSITGVTTAPAASAGACDESDYLLVDAAMPIGRTLAPGESAGFAGARIGFMRKPVNQDACKRAVVDLRYVGTP